MIQKFDIAIVGGGPVGSALALALRESSLNIVILEARSTSNASSDPRALALSYGSRLLLTQNGIWQQLQQVSAIKTIHISQKKSFGRTLLKADDMGIPELGYVLPYASLQAALQQAVQQTKLDFKDGATVKMLEHESDCATLTVNRHGVETQISAKLVVIADGGKLLESSHPAEVKDYGQSALIAHITCSNPQADTAFERFTPQGPIALLPYQNGYEIVWTVPHEDIDDMLSWNDNTLLSQLHQHFGDRVGDFLTVGPRSTFPLRLKRAPETILPHNVLIGNAAQTLHPVAGQGFNLGLRDAWELAQLILNTTHDELGSASMLAKYELARKADRCGGIQFTNGLVRLFSNDLPVLNASRAASLSLLDCLPGMKKFVARRMMFGANG